MNDSPQKIWERLRSRLLLPVERVEHWPVAPHETDVASFLERLTGEGWLTTFQRDEILAGRLDGLFLGNYRLQRELKHGPQGRVFQAEHLLLRQPVIVRVLSDGPSLLRSGVAQWLDQVARVARWNHPVIQGVIDAGILPGHSTATAASLDSGQGLYFISPLVEGFDLRHLVFRDGPFPVELACEILYQVAHALAEAHARNMVHGYLGPSSILRTSEGKIKIVDFGLKTWPSESYASLSAPPPLEPGTIQGDLFGMAQCLYWTLTGQSVSPQGHELLPDAPIRSLRPDLPANLDDLMQGLIHRDKRQDWTFPKIKEALLPFVAASPSNLTETTSEDGYTTTLVLPPSPIPISRPLAPLLPQEKPSRNVLIVDDEPSIRSLCRLALSRTGLQCDEAANGDLALRAFANHSYDLVLLDIDMPEMDGLEVCRRLRRIPDRPHLKIILFSGRIEGDVMAPMLLTGADDFLSKPFSPILLQSRVQAALRLKLAQERADVLTRDLLILNRQMEDHLHARDSDLVGARNALVLGLAKLAEFRDTDTGMHLNRLQVFSRRLAEDAIKHPMFAGQMDRNFIDLLACCAPLHDIGKVGLPDNILLKPGKLNDEERRLMETHTTIGANTLDRIAQEHGFARAFLQMSIDIARHHHERFDGSGYPDQLSGTSIPLSARIVAVCDVYDALRSRRVYKPSLPHATVLEFIRQGDNSHFDPALVQCFEQCQEDFAKIYASLHD